MVVGEVCMGVQKFTEGVMVLEVRNHLHDSINAVTNPGRREYEGGGRDRCFDQSESNGRHRKSGHAGQGKLAREVRMGRYQVACSKWRAPTPDTVDSQRSSVS